MEKDNTYSVEIIKDTNGIERYKVSFIDGAGQLQIAEVDKEQAVMIVGIQKTQANRNRMERKNCISLDAMDYEGDYFASGDSFFDDDLSEEEKVSLTMKKLKPKYRMLLQMKYFENKTQKEIAEELGHNQSSVSRQLETALGEFEKIYKNIF